LSAGAALASAFAGMMLGEWRRIHVAAATFRRCFLLALLAVGAHLLLRSLA